MPSPLSIATLFVGLLAVAHANPLDTHTIDLARRQTFTTVTRRSDPTAHVEGFAPTFTKTFIWENWESVETADPKHEPVKESHGGAASVPTSNPRPEATTTSTTETPVTTSKSHAVTARQAEVPDDVWYDDQGRSRTRRIYMRPTRTIWTVIGPEATY